jgi:hypothetical protein
MTDNKRAADDAEREAVNRWSIEQKVFLTPDQWDALWIALSSRADGGKGEAVTRYDLNGEFMKTSAHGEWIRFDDTAPQAECAPREAQPIYLVSSEGRFWQIVSEPVWVNWQADYRNVLYTAAREVQPVSIEKEDDSEIACISCGLTLGESRLITSHAERKGRGYITKDAVERAKRVMAAVDTYHERPDGGNRHALRSILMDEFEELLAAPTPERAQPVGPRTTLNFDGTVDITCAHCGGNGCFACLKSAAPTPERADADTAGAKPTCPHCGLTDIEFSRVCHNSACSGYAKEESFYRGWENTAAPASQERADAGKDAALTDEEIRAVIQRALEGGCIGDALFVVARAIEQAVKERK